MFQIPEPIRPDGSSVSDVCFNHIRGISRASNKEFQRALKIYGESIEGCQGCTRDESNRNCPNYDPHIPTLSAYPPQQP